MKTITTLDELQIPDKHKRFITNFLAQSKQIPTFNQIDLFILFGSCARGDATEKSDVDILAVGENIGDETLFDLYDCAYYPDCNLKENFVGNDVFVNCSKSFSKYSEVLGSFEWRVKRDGVLLNGLL